MPDAASVLLQRLQAAFDTIAPGADPVLRPSDRADFQANGALPLAKVVGRPPRQVAEEVVAAASLDDICAEVEVSGPGFINLTLSDRFVAGAGGGTVRRRAAGRGAGRPPRDRGHRLLVAQRGQGDARRPSPQHAHRGRPGPRARLPRSRRAAREPHRRLGHAVRHAHRVPARRGRGRQRRVVQRAGSQRVLRRGPAAVRQRPRLRRALPQPRRAAADRRRRDAAPLAHLRRRVHAPRRRGLRAARRPPDPPGRRGGELLQPAAARRRLRARREGPAGGERRGPLRVPRGVREPQRRAAPADRAQVRRRLRLPGDRPGQCARPHRPHRRHQDRLRRREPSSPCTSASSSPSRPSPATCATRTRPSTSASASSSGRTARSWPAVPAVRSVSSTC